MSFVKVQRTERNTVGFPALHIFRNGQAFINQFALKEMEIEVPEDLSVEIPVVKFDLYFDKDKSQFAIKFTKHGEMSKTPDRTRKQIIFFVKSVFKSNGLMAPSGAFPIKKHKDSELGTIWVAQLPELKEKTEKDREMELLAKKARKKSKHR